MKCRPTHAVLLSLLVLLPSLVSTAVAKTLHVDSTSSRLRFEVDHGDYVKGVKGRFRDFKGTIEFDESRPDEISIDIEIDVESLTTANRYRDGHLKTSFFETDLHPTAYFHADRIETDAQGRALVGELTLKGVTRTVRLRLMGGQRTVDAEGRSVLHQRARGQVDRRAHGVEENADRASGLQKIIAHVQEGLDEFIAGEVDISLVVVAREE